jgi:hypothetical protein
MFGALYYTIGCFFIAGIFTFISAMFRPIQDKGESKPWLTFMIWMVLVFSAPYLYAEVLTRYVAKDVEKVVKDSYTGVDVNGPMRFYRVIWYTGENATVVAVGKEPQSWGGTDRPVVSFKLAKNGEGNGWECVSYRMVYSDRLNKDGISFPPYW